MQEQQSLTERPQSAVANPMETFYHEAGSGFEEVRGDDLAVPFLSIVQKTSAIIEDGTPEFDPDAKFGMMVNSISGDLYGSEGVSIIPCYFRCFYTEKQPGKNGKFVTEHSAGEGAALLAQATRNADGFDQLANGNVLVRTARHYCFLVDTMEPVVLTMRSTSTKVSKRWLSQLAGRKMELPDGKTFNPPMFSSLWTLATVKHENDDGSWYVFAPQLDRDLDLESDDDRTLFGMARDFAGMVKGDQVREVGDDD